MSEEITLSQIEEFAADLEKSIGNNWSPAGLVSQIAIDMLKAGYRKQPTKPKDEGMHLVVHGTPESKPSPESVAQHLAARRAIINRSW